VDLLGGLFKTLVFGVLIAAIGCQRGLKTEQGPGAVGDSTTRAVVAGIVLTILADGVLGCIYYYLGI
jgi:phospholipid/cholesterol/gamma-HCH transport system permease protein